MFNIRNLSFGGPAAVVTSMAIIIGLDSATSSKSTIITSLLIIAIADNLTDSLSIHIFQESDTQALHQAFKTTIANFFTRFILSLSFIILIMLFHTTLAITICMIWGFALLSLISLQIARIRNISAFTHIWRHATVAFAVIIIAKVVGSYLPVFITRFNV